MLKKKNKKDLRIAELERKNRELEGQMAHVYHFAEIGLVKATRDNTFGSGVLVTMAYLGGREVCHPFMLKDGLSDATIAALCDDLAYSYNKTMEFKPTGS